MANKNSKRIYKLIRKLSRNHGEGLDGVRVPFGINVDSAWLRKESGKKPAKLPAGNR